MSSMFDFDAPVSRLGTNAEKYTSLKRLYGREDLLPFWVADMEFAVAPAIQKALAARVNHPLYGYSSIPESLIEEVVSWNRKRYGLSIKSESITLVPGVMAGISAAIFALSEPGDSIVVQPPLYPPLIRSVHKNGRKLIENPLVIRDGSYCMDLDELEQLFQRYQPRILLLCSPHNPVGRVWNKDELINLAELTQRYNVYLVSDEIHADIVFRPHEHVSALSLIQGGDNRIIVLNSASKSFNVAGLNTAYAFIPDLRLRSSFRQQLRCMNVYGVNLFGMIALEAAYTEGEEWLEALLGYLFANRQFMTKTLKSELAGLELFIPEGTYLYWLNFNSLGLDVDQIRERLVEVARVGLNDGITFSQYHGGFWRFNFAVPRTMLEQGLDRMISAFT